MNDNNDTMSKKPRKIKPDHIRQRIKRMLDDGSLERIAEGADSDKEIYESLGISKTKWFQLKKENPKLNELIMRARYETFLEIKGAMRRRARGYDYDEVEEVSYVDKKTGQEKKSRVVKTTKHVPGDITAQKLILANLASYARKAGDNGPMTEWSNDTAILEVKSESTVALSVDETIKEVLKGITDDQ